MTLTLIQLRPKILSHWFKTAREKWIIWNAKQQEEEGRMSGDPTLHDCGLYTQCLWNCKH